MAAPERCAGHPASRGLPATAGTGSADARDIHCAVLGRGDQTMRSADLALILTGVLLNAVAQLLLKAGSRAIADVTLSAGNAWTIIERIAINPPILGGLLCYAISVVVWILALSRVEVSIAYPMLSIGYVVNAIAAWMLFGEDLNMARVTGIGVIIVGVWLVARS